MKWEENIQESFRNCKKARQKSLGCFQVAYSEALATSAGEEGGLIADSSEGATGAGEENLTTLGDGDDVAALGQPEAEQVLGTAGVDVKGLVGGQIVVDRPCAVW